MKCAIIVAIALPLTGCAEIQSIPFIFSGADNNYKAHPTPTPIEMSDSKTRGDSVIDTKLNEKQREEFFIFVESNTLNDSAARLHSQFKIDLSINAISRWAARIRKEKGDISFLALLSDIKQDAERAETFAQEIGTAHKLNDANVTMLSQALFRSRHSGDPALMKMSAKLLSMVLESVAKSKAAEASVISAETARSRFQFDAAKAALAAAADLQDIQKSSGSEREKVDRAVNRLFGKRPSDRGQTSEVSGQTEGAA